MLTGKPSLPIQRPVRAGSSVVEHVTFNHVVEGSIPSPLTSKIRYLGLFSVPSASQNASQAGFWEAF